MQRKGKPDIKKCRSKNRPAKTEFVAEREGFEPSVEYKPHTRLAGEHHRPTRSSLHNWSDTFIMAEGVGFEPTVLSYNGFQDRRLKPLGHPSNVNE